MTAGNKVLEVLGHNVTDVVLSPVYHIYFFALYVKAKNYKSSLRLFDCKRKSYVAETYNTDICCL